MASNYMGSSDEDSMSAASTLPNSPDSTCRVVIVEQPMEKVRFRYLSELQGMPHGPLLGENSTKSSKSFPRVKLEGYDGIESVKIRCWLVDKAPRSLGGDIRPHCHDLVVRKNIGKNEIVPEPHEKAVSRDNNYTAVFENMVVLHCVQRNSESTYFSKERKWKNRLAGVSSSDTNKFDKKTIRDTIKCINKNEVYLYFEAFVETRDSEHILCWTLSQPIKNLKNPVSGDLKIIKVVNSYGSADGNTEIALFTEKVPPDVKVQFCDDKNQWKELVQPETTHRNLAITIRSPQYPYAIGSSVKVKFCLYRESDGCESNAMEFTYHPSENTVTGKRRRIEMCPEELQHPTDSMGTNVLMPFNGKVDDADLENMLMPDENDITDIFSRDNWSGSSLIEKLAGCSSGHSDIIIEIDSTLVESDGVEEHHENGPTLQNGTTKRQASQLDTPVEKLIKNVLLTTEYRYHVNCLQKAVIAGNDRQLIKLLNLLKNYAKSKQKLSLIYNIANIRDDKGRTLLHTATLLNNTRIIQVLLEFGCDPLHQDQSGDNCFHLAASNQAKYVLQKLVSGSIRLPRSGENPLSNNNPLSPSVLSETNSNGLNILHIAVRAKRIQNVDYILQTNLLDPNSKDMNSGDTALHIACRLELFEIALLLIKNGADVKDVNLSGFTPLHISVARNDHRMADLLIKEKSDPKQECISLTKEIESKVEYQQMGCEILPNMLARQVPTLPENSSNAFALANDVMMYNILCGKMCSLDLTTKESDPSTPQTPQNDLFTSDQFDRLCQILDENGNWELVAKELKLLELLTPVFKEPAKVLMNYIRSQKNRILAGDDPRNTLIKILRSVKLDQAAEILESH